MSITAAERRRGYRDPAKCCHSRVVFVGGNPYCPDCCTYGCFNEGPDFPSRPFVWPKGSHGGAVRTVRESRSSSSGWLGAR